MATLKIPVYGTGRIEKVATCSRCGVRVRRYATFEQAQTPWNVGPEGVKSRAEIVGECREEAEAWRADPEVCKACDPDRDKNERNPVRSQVHVYRDATRIEVLYSASTDVAPRGLNALAKLAGVKAIESGASATSWDLIVEIHNTVLDVSTYWKLSPKPGGGFNARRILP